MTFEQTLKKLNTPEKIQDFLNSLPFNFEKKGETCMSPKRVLENKTAHCFEGALFAAAALQVQGQKPLLLDLKASGKDDDHVLALFKQGKYWGAISKTNHAVLRYREPIYATARELAVSYFHEYFLPDGTKTLKSFSKPFDLSKIKTDWIRSDKNLFVLTRMLDKSSHMQIVPKDLKLRKADDIEIKAGEIVEYKK
jgi:hypothetical protein